MIPTTSNRRSRHTRGWLACFAVSAIVAAGVAPRLRAADVQQGAKILRDLQTFNEMGSVLHVAAHPDDENTQLLTYLALGRHYRTAYLSLTRGDGGQNLLGPELGEQLGVARTQELLAARRLDGGQQFFTRAVDFGFSKDVTQTLQFWDRKQVVGDIVRVIRTFRPDVIVTRFSTTPGTTHGHHTASAVLALEAFGLSGDANAYPEQLTTLSVWQPKRIFMNSGGFGPAPAGGGASAPIRIDISGTDPVTGESFSTIAGRSRAMHKTQGFGNFGILGGRGGGPRTEAFQLMAGEPATKDILDGVDTTWGRVPSGADIGRVAGDVIAKFNPQDPVASVPALLDIHARLAALPDDIILNEKRQRLDRIIQACIGLSVETLVDQPDAVPGEKIKLRHMAIVHSAVPVEWASVKYLADAEQLKEAVDLHPDQAATREAVAVVPANTPLSQPYWLREDHPPGMFTVSDASLIGMPDTPPAFPIEHLFTVGGRTIVIPDEPLHIRPDKSKGEIRDRLAIIPPVSIGVTSPVRLFAPGGERPVEVELTASRAGAAGKVGLDVPSGWKVSTASQDFHLEAASDRAKFTFTVVAPPESAVAGIIAWVVVNGVRYSNQRIEIRYDHIPPQLLQPTARIKAISADVAIRGKKIGYLLGAGDRVADALREMGYAVTMLKSSDLTAEGLKDYDAVVIGVRAFNVRTDLAAGMPALLAYVEAGGNVVDQYNTPNDVKSPRLGPYDLKLSGNLPHNRVTDPRAAVTMLVPDHPAFNTPNRITPADFDGWIQERGLNFPSEWDKEHWTALLACSDASEAPLKSGLLVAHYGKGYYVYTGYSFFRQLPAGVPGAYRLFANLVCCANKVNTD